MSEPTTFTGRHNAAWYKGVDDGQLVYGELVGPSDVAAVRAEARATAEAQLAELVRVSAELVGTIERGDDHLTVLRAASAVNQRMAAIENEQAPAPSRFLDLDAPETVERLAAQLMRLYGRSYQTEGIWHPDARAILAALREPAAEDVQAHVSPCRSNRLSPHRWASTCLTTPKPKED